MLAMQAAAHDNVIKLVNVIENSHQVVIMYEMWVVCLFFAQENNKRLVEWQMTFFLRLHGEEPLKLFSSYVKAIVTLMDWYLPYNKILVGVIISYIS